LESWTIIDPSNAARSFNDLDQLLRIEELFLLQRVAQKINSILDLETLLDEIVGDVATTFGYNRLAVLLKDDHTDELVIAAGWTGELCLKGTRFKIGQGSGIGAHAAATGQTFYAPDVRKVPFYVVGEEDTRSEIDIPLKSRGELLGIFNVQHTELNAFSPERIRLLEALAGHVGTAIANARMFQRERFEKQRMAKQLEEARAVQSGLFPVNAPEARGFDVTGVCRPCREVGGDWYDYIPLQGSVRVLRRPDGTSACDAHGVASSAVRRGDADGAGEYTFEYEIRTHGIVIVRIVNGLIANWREYEHESPLSWKEMLGANSF
jgi:phosphoserine phosphatase RsbU/P